MVHRAARVWFLVALGFVATLLWPAWAHDNDCRIKEITSVSPLSANAGTLKPPHAPIAQAVTITIGLRTKGHGACHGSLAFNRPILPATMAQVGGGGKLPYTIQSAAGGGKSLLFAGVDPGDNRLDFAVHGHAHSVTLTVYVLMQPGPATIAAGFYTDHRLTLQVFNRDGWHLKPVASRSFAISGSVVQVCQMPAPDVASLNFNSAISNGLPNPAVVFTSTFHNVSCTAPARIRLSGERLQPASPVVAVSNFDNFIHWRANATFGAANVELNTKVANQAMSTLQNVPSGATSGATITVNVNLLQGQRVIAGTYSGVLTVTIDPML